MAYKGSTRFTNMTMNHCSAKRALSQTALYMYTGTQPATGDAAPTGTLLGVLTPAGGALTDEVTARGKVSLTGGAAGSVDGITVNSIQIMSGAVAYNASLTQTVIDVVANINAFETMPNYRALASGTDILIEAMPGTGTGPNGLAVSSTSTTITTSNVNMGTTRAGVAAVNGITWGPAVGNIMNLPAGVTLTCTSALATGTAGWARLKRDGDDNALDDANQKWIRYDFSIGSSGQDINGTTAITIGNPINVTALSITLPTS